MKLNTFHILCFSIIIDGKLSILQRSYIEVSPFNTIVRKTYMKLENLRHEDIGETYAWLPELGEDYSNMILISYPTFAEKAFYFACQSLEQLEQSKDCISQGNTNHASIGLWFMSVESFINSILKILCRVHKINFSEYVKKMLVQD